MKRVTAIRAASIWRLVIHAGSIDLIPKEPKANSAPREALPFMRPFCIFLNFVLFGCNMFVFYLIRQLADICFNLLINYPLFEPPRFPPRLFPPRFPPRPPPLRLSRRSPPPSFPPRVFVFDVCPMLGDKSRLP